MVAHSAGGGTIALVADQARVDRQVFVTAVVPEPGRSLLEVAGTATQETIASVSIDHGDGTLSLDLAALRGERNLPGT